MGIYYHPEQLPIVPDGFLSLSVERFYDEELRPSYVLWEEQVVPNWQLAKFFVHHSSMFLTSTV
jgi:hypothetical protein